MIAMGVEEARMAANVAVKVIDGDLVERITVGSENTPEYRSLFEAMTSVQKELGIMYIYTLYTDGNRLYYGVETDTSDLAGPVGKPFERDYSEFAEVFAGESYVQKYIDYSEYGDVITAYLPVRNSAGKIVGIVGCDYDAANVVEKMNTMTVSTFVMAAVCLVAAIAIFSFIIGRIVRELKNINKKIFDLVHSEGDLTKTLDIHTGDELEIIADNVNALLEHIRGIMLKISKGSDELNISSHNIVEELGNADTSISDISSTMEEMSAGIEETSASLSQINEFVLEAYRSVEKISGDATQGSTSSGEIMGKVTQIYSSAEQEKTKTLQQAREIAASVNERIERSKSVAEISVLSENIIAITDETNLLALNASIEAARAGEAGRGFSVVASEIGKLAADSASAAEKIQSVSGAVIQAVNELAKEAEVMTRFLEETAMQGYEKLLDTSGSYRDDVSNMNYMLKTFSEQSNMVCENVDHIKEAISAINIAVEENAKGITNVTEMSVNLAENVTGIRAEADANNEIAAQLDTEVRRFKLE